MYDYVEAAGEVVVFDRAARKFTIINNSEGVFTHVTFDEVNHMLRARGPKTEEYVQELKTQKSPEADRAARTLAFQLNPNFENQFDLCRQHMSPKPFPIMAGRCSNLLERHCRRKVVQRKISAIDQS